MSGPVRCANCMTVFTPPADVPTVPVVRPRNEPAARSHLDEPVHTTPPSRGWVWLLVISCTLLTFTCFGSCAGIFGIVSNPSFKPYTAEDGSFTAIFPGDVFPLIRSANDGRDVSGVECRRDIPEEHYFVEYVTLTNAEKAKDAQKLAEEAAAKWINNQSGSLMEQEVVDHRGLPASQIFGQISIFKGNVAIRAMRDGDRMYVIGVSGGITPGSDRVSKFFDEFVPKGAADHEKRNDPAPAPPKKDGKKNPFKAE